MYVSQGLLSHIAASCTSFGYRVVVTCKTLPLYIVPDVLVQQRPRFKIVVSQRMDRPVHEKQLFGLEQAGGLVEIQASTMADAAVGTVVKHRTLQTTPNAR